MWNTSMWTIYYCQWDTGCLKFRISPNERTTISKFLCPGAYLDLVLFWVSFLRAQQPKTITFDPGLLTRHSFKTRCSFESLRSNIEIRYDRFKKCLRFLVFKVIISSSIVNNSKWAPVTDWNKVRHQLQSFPRMRFPTFEIYVGLWTGNIVPLSELSHLVRFHYYQMIEEHSRLAKGITLNEMSHLVMCFSGGVLQ